MKFSAESLLDQIESNAESKLSIDLGLSPGQESHLNESVCSIIHKKEGAFPPSRFEGCFAILKVPYKGCLIYMSLSTTSWTRTFNEPEQAVHHGEACDCDFIFGRGATPGLTLAK